MLAGTTPKNASVPADALMNATNTASTTCPAIMLASKRIANTKCLISSPSTSITKIMILKIGMSISTGHVHVRNLAHPEAERTQLDRSRHNDRQERDQGQRGRRAQRARGRTGPRHQSQQIADQHKEENASAETARSDRRRASRSWAAPPDRE